MSKLVIPIIFENENFLVLNKPAGISVHPDGFNQTPTITDWLIKNYPELEGVGEAMILANGTEISRPGIVHRLDKDTSGVLVIAKNQKTFLELKEKFKNHKVEKTYQAIVYGEVKKDQGVIDLPIGRSKNDPRKRVASTQADGKLREAVTRYEVVEKFKGFSLLKLFPKTGRTHQLRVHLKAIGYPIVGDTLYAFKNAENLLTISRQALHANYIKFSLNGESFAFEAPLAKDLIATIDYLKGVC
ncbi:MAG: RluA family pseudouridine synthase [Patescibacteria group bacterium]